MGTLANVVAASMAAFVLSKSNLKYKNKIFIVIQFSLMFSAYTLAIPRYLIYKSLNIMDTYWIYILPAIPSATSVFLMKQYMEDVGAVKYEMGYASAIAVVLFLMMIIARTLFIKVLNTSGK